MFNYITSSVYTVIDQTLSLTYSKLSSAYMAYPEQISGEGSSEWGIRGMLGSMRNEFQIRRKESLIGKGGDTLGKDQMAIKQLGREQEMENLRNEEYVEGYEG